MQHNATITRKISTSYTNSIPNIRSLNQMVQKLGKYQIKQRDIFKYFFFETSPNVYQTFYTSVVSSLAKFYKHPSSNGIPWFLRTIFCNYFEMERHHSVNTRRTEKNESAMFMHYLSKKYQGPSTYDSILRDRPPLISFDTD